MLQDAALFCRIRKILANRTEGGDERAAALEAKLREAQQLLQETERKYEEVGEAFTTYICQPWLVTTVI